MRLSERDREVLAELDAACENHRRVGRWNGWVKPMDVGGRNGSDHSYRLGKLVKLGLAEVNRPPLGNGNRPGKLYRITEAGRRALESE